jgi:hypothetical protein
MIVELFVRVGNHIPLTLQTTVCRNTHTKGNSNGAPQIGHRIGLIVMACSHGPFAADSATNGQPFEGSLVYLDAVG